MAPTRVLVVDDSRTIRQIVRAILSRDPFLEVVGEAADPYEARAAIKALNPDVITLDVEMPRMDGLEFLGHLMRLRPMPVVMVSSLTQKGSAAAVRALSLGAIECVDREEIRKDVNGGTRLCSIVRMAARATVSRRAETAALPSAENYDWNGRILMIGSSTGGVDALERIFRRFPENCPPTLVSQHMPPAFLASFADRMNEAFRPRIKIAEAGERLEQGKILMAPGGRHHLRIAGRLTPVVDLSEGDGTDLHVPSVGVMFDSALHRAADVVAAILTGMGRDGAEAMLRLRQAGATTLAQSGHTAVVDGMPRVAREIGAAGRVVDLDHIAQALLSACGRELTAA
ncbi:chemotaxis-specific protein-glutamate methyltransferase CheB [Roseitranquillus sediminis]|uniref:chemotaxis-specific protein-glutamate methyltransferase CheB n=1 Tax=Roseitranquillus sediminis TaxID=2809051 RepID=UPI001D0BF5C6|nr:chemotaxis-specific protein-glutamate methyltransferase CheB [Roseitranquillus sediminis]MBM9593054.1 chemotaxis-specific protein-glutamate methyltransferase CheB [Roseitranquillus sediminis]